MRRTLNLAGIFCLVAAIFGVVSLTLDIFYYEFSVYDIIFDAVCVTLSITTGTVYLVFRNKKQDYISKRRTIFFGAFDFEYF